MAQRGGSIPRSETLCLATHRPEPTWRMVAAQREKRNDNRRKVNHIGLIGGRFPAFRIRAIYFPDDLPVMGPSSHHASLLLSFRLERARLSNRGRVLAMWRNLPARASTGEIRAVTPQTGSRRCRTDSEGRSHPRDKGCCVLTVLTPRATDTR